MFICRNCGKETPRLKADYKLQDAVCPDCFTGNDSVQYGLNLHDPLIDDGKTRLTKGKAREIDQRTLSKDDGFTVINRVTGKETQY
jgi:hypothetical protein